MRVNWQSINGTPNGITPLPVKSNYEIMLEGMASIELLQEYESVTIAFGCAYRPGINCERVRLCRRELARRLFARPNVA